MTIGKDVSFNGSLSVVGMSPSKYGEYVTLIEHLLGGVHMELKFPNGWGASIIRHSGSYGVELAVLDNDGDLSYDTPVTGDVLGWLDPDTLEQALNDIIALPPITKEVES